MFDSSVSGLVLVGFTRHQHNKNHTEPKIHLKQSCEINRYIDTFCSSKIEEPNIFTKIFMNIQTLKYLPHPPTKKIHTHTYISHSLTNKLQRVKFVTYKQTGKTTTYWQTPYPHLYTKRTITLVGMWTVSSHFAICKCRFCLVADGVRLQTGITVVLTPGTIREIYFVFLDFTNGVFRNTYWHCKHKFLPTENGMNAGFFFSLPFCKNLSGLNNLGWSQCLSSMFEEYRFALINVRRGILYPNIVTSSSVECSIENGAGKSVCDFFS